VGNEPASSATRFGASGLVVLGLICQELGAAIAITLFPQVGATGMVLLRLAFSAAILLIVFRPSFRGRSRGDWLTVVGFGLVLATMNAFFYESLLSVPLGAAVTIGIPVYTAAESAETTSASSRASSACATALLPDAVGPKIARTLGVLGGFAAGLLEAMLDLAGLVLGYVRAIFLGMVAAPFAEPGNGIRNPLCEWRCRCPAEQIVRLADVGDVVRHLAEQRRFE